MQGITAANYCSYWFIETVLDYNYITHISKNVTPFPFFCFKKKNVQPLKLKHVLICTNNNLKKITESCTNSLMME